MHSRFVLQALALALALAGLQSHAQTQVYRWVDKDGKVQFTDTPPPKEARDVTEKRMGGGYVEEGQVPYATRMAAQRNPVTLYTSNDCGELCAQGRALLNRRGIPFSEKNAQASKADAEALKKLAGGLQVPYMLVGETPVRGFDEELWQSALDRAGYARTRLPGQPGYKPE